MEKHRCKPSLTRCPFRGRNCCRPRSAGHKSSSDTHHDEEPVVRSSAYFYKFGRLAAANRKRRGLGKPETFTFLGFTFICSKTRRGKFQIKRKSRRDRMQAKLQAIKQELRRSMHQPIPQQGRWLQQVVTGY